MRVNYRGQPHRHPHRPHQDEPERDRGGGDRLLVHKIGPAAPTLSPGAGSWMFNSIEARDNGMWQCNVGVVENNEVRVENGSATITIADPEPPTKLSLETPYDMVTSNFSEGEC